MASKITKKMNTSVEGILDLTDGFIKFEVEDVDDPVLLAELIKEFNGKKIKITAAYGEEL
ncbi:MAG: hypothetical protein RR806_06180 [Oscillospiraceae bacterium]